MTDVVEVAVGIGSNIAPHRYVPAAIEALTRVFGALELSTLYRCPAVGFDGDAFINLVVLFETDQPIEQVQSTLRTIEADNGRAERARDGSRTLDLDLLLYGEQVYDDGDIRVPRADITDYAFVLAPLAELRPDGVHPTQRLSFATLWQADDAPRQPLHAVSWASLADTE